MTKVFNYMERSKELFGQGITADEAAAIMADEELQADYSVLDDGAWWRELDDLRREAEAEVEAELAMDA